MVSWCRGDYNICVYWCVGTRVENTAAGEARTALVVQMVARLIITQVRPVLGARGRTIAFLRSILMASRVKTEQGTVR